MGGKADHMPSSGVTVNSMCVWLYLFFPLCIHGVSITLSSARGGQVSVSPSLESRVTQKSVEICVNITMKTFH